MARSGRDARQTAAEIAKVIDSGLLDLARELRDTRLERMLVLISTVAHAYAADPEHPALDRQTLVEIEIEIGPVARARQ